jgi:eukaryotic-like serine/threonine-protein kinase
MAADDVALATPERLGRYELLLPIGTGGMATVYLARTEVVAGLHRHVAVKLMHPQFRADSDEGSQVLIEEAKLVAQIQHPNVVAIEEAIDGPHGVYLVMEYVEGDTLSGLIREAKSSGGSIPLPIVGRILADALAGLHVAHELTDSAGQLRNVVHRDFTPSNILVGIDGVTRLTDFGIAKAESRVSMTTTGQIKGKVGYMSPEQVLAKPLDRRCDVWAAGVVAWECLAGRRLHRDDDQLATLLKIVQAEPPLLRTVREDLPEPMERVVASALTALDGRCPTAAELQRRLLDAWRPISGIAEPAAVGAYVAELARQRLDKRRRQMADVLRLREQLARVSRSAIAMVRVDGASSPSAPSVEPAAVEPVMATAEPHLAVARDVRPAHRTWIRLSAATLAVGLAAVLFWRLPSAASPDAGSAAPALEAASDPLPPASAVPALPAGETEPTALLVRANAPIASLRIDDRTIAFAEPGREVEVQLRRGERGGPIDIEATAEDGRKTESVIAPGAGEMDLSFAEPPPPVAAIANRAGKGGVAKPGALGRPTRAGPKPTSKPASGGQPGLAPPPYGQP